MKALEKPYYFIDTHCHLFADQFNSDREQVMQRALERGVMYFLLPNIDSESIAAMKNVVNTWPTHCFPMIGLHPTSVKENYLEELEIALAELKAGNYIGIGEIGLDFYWDTTFSAQQKEAFRTQLRWAKEYALPVAIHNRNSFAEALAIVQEEKDSRLRGVFHCFSGSMEEAQQILALDDFYMGIGGVATFKNGGSDKVLPFIPLDRLLLETDAPWLAPVPHRGKRNEPSYIPDIAQKLAELCSTSLENIAEQTTLNARRLFRGLPNDQGI